MTLSTIRTRQVGFLTDSVPCSRLHSDHLCLLIETLRRLRTMFFRQRNASNPNYIILAKNTPMTIKIIIKARFVRSDDEFGFGVTSSGTRDLVDLDLCALSCWCSNHIENLAVLEINMFMVVRE